LDRNGVNGYSSLPCDPVAYRLAKEPTVMPPKPFARMMPFHVAYTIAHCLAHYAAKPFFRHYDPNWPSSPLKQALGYLTRVTMDKLTWRRQRKAERDVISGTAPFFLCALQKSGDTQINEHSDFLNVVQFINYVTESFAQFAPPDAKLVFKAHPLDYGIEPQETAVRVAGKAHGILDRLVFLPTGSLTDLMAAAKGMVTVNSTAGLTAALKGLPTAIVGEAFYKIEGLVSTNGIDHFWANPKRPDWNIAERFLAVAAAKTQINGSYYSPAGREMALPVAAARMLDRSPDDPEHTLNRRAERTRMEAEKVSGSGPDTPGARPGLA
jgi:capsular polysaccharide export protein